MVKKPVKCPGLCSSSKDQSKDQSQAKRSKHKSGAGKEKSVEQDKGKKKKRCKATHTDEADVSTIVDTTEVADVALDQTDEEGAEQEQVADQEPEADQDTGHIHISDEELSPLANPFIPIPCIADTHNYMRENDRGIYKPHVVQALIDSIILP